MRLTSVPRVLVPAAVGVAVLFGMIGPAAALTSVHQPPDATVLEQQAPTPQGKAGVPPVVHRAAADTTEETLDDLQKAIDDLVAAIVSGGSPTDALPALLDTVTGVVNTILDTALGALPPITLPTLPPLPITLPVTLPETPVPPVPPVIPETPLPPLIPETPTLPVILPVMPAS